ncbi:hypothetical protein ABPG74_021613 [Tetrahymena malaccensis]
MGGCVATTKSKGEAQNKQLPILKRQDEEQNEYLQEYYEYVNKCSTFCINNKVMELLQINNSNQEDTEKTKQTILDQYEEIYQDYPKKDQIYQNIEQMKIFCMNLDKQKEQNIIKVFLIIFEEEYLKKLVNNFQSLHSEFLQYLKEQNLQQNILAQLNSVISSSNVEDLNSIDLKLKKKLYDEFKLKLSQEIKIFQQKKEKMSLNKQAMVEIILISKLSKSDDKNLQPLIQMTQSYLQGQPQFIDLISKIYKSQSSKCLPSTCPQIPQSELQVNQVNKFQTNPFPSQKSESFSTLVFQFDNKYTSNNINDGQILNQPNNMKDKMTSFVIPDDQMTNLNQEANQQIKEKQIKNINDASSSKQLDVLSTKNTIQSDETNKNNHKYLISQHVQPNSSSSQLINTFANKYDMPHSYNNDKENNEQNYETQKNVQQNSSSSQLINTFNNKYAMSNLHNDDQKYETQKNTQQPNSTSSQLILTLNNKYSMPQLHDGNQEQNEQKYEPQKNTNQNSSSSQLIQTFNNKYSMPETNKENQELKQVTQQYAQPASSSSQIILNLNTKYGLNDNQIQIGKSNQNSLVQVNAHPTFSTSQIVREQENKYKLQNSYQDSQQQSQSNQTANFKINEQNVNSNNKNQIQDEKEFIKILPNSVCQPQTNLNVQSENEQNKDEYNSKLHKNQTASQVLKEFNTDLPIGQKQKNSSILTQGLDSNQQGYNAQNIVSFLGSVLNTETS